MYLNPLGWIMELDETQTLEKISIEIRLEQISSDLIWYSEFKL